MDRIPDAVAKIVVQAPADRVWAALTTPALIKQYFFGSDIVTDWKVGHPILYRGEWQGKPYEDKGMVVAVEPGKRLVVTHWSPLSGTPDSPENYHTVSYELVAQGPATQVTLTQSNSATEDERQHSEQNWKMVLEGLKKLLES